MKLAGGTYYAYSGCPEGRSFDECGIKGVILCEMNKDSGKLSASFASRRICRRHYEKISVDVTGVSSNAELCDRIKSALTEENCGADALVRVKLCGRISPEAALSPEKLSAQMFGVFYLEIQNDTVPLLNDEELKNDISIRGAFSASFCRCWRARTRRSAAPPPPLSAMDSTRWTARTSWISDFTENL